MEVVTKQSFELIASNLEILGGKPCIKGTRISVDMILEWLATGASIQDICKTYPHLNEKSIIQAILYAATRLKNESFFELRKTA
ncbi:MAG TPA: DUF433 domain-containing protein [Leptospiraceae bacterium]|nr:DUF433 domain-containing protein [Leptospiraceae bacterium]HMW04817.1 DUF433 domain-containing protein [Leptospiraceae bacterium]HMX34975.1 DUF433 domain-containing protein [Leptospiraceae bacterium]HMY33515.1 DUF433 domain-containing protein [Leptospiraceae bacterium]HMZ66102.1 DUF433 domain-containing protein [Leptospiraceae bacterium]